MSKRSKAKTNTASRAPRTRRRTDDYTVTVDLPDPLPITDAELDLLERELADFLEELLSDRKPRG
jgi:hypothetical protein